MTYYYLFYIKIVIWKWFLHSFQVINMINIVLLLQFCWQPKKGFNTSRIDAKIQSFHVNDLKINVILQHENLRFNINKNEKGYVFWVMHISYQKGRQSTYRYCTQGYLT